MFFSFGIFLNIFTGGDLVFAQEQKIKLKFLSSWGSEYIYTKEFVIPFVDRLSKRSNGRLEVTWVGPEAVPTFEQLKPLSTGVFDFLFSSPAYHMGELAHGASMDMIKGSAKDRRAAGFYEVLDEGYKKVNAKTIALIGGASYTFQLKKELKKADFKGLKLRASPFYDPMIKELGGTSVRIAVGETYSALEKGVVDGAAAPVWNALDWKWHEVAKYQLRPTYGEVVNWGWINLDTWNKLPKDMQNLVSNVSIELEEQARNNLMNKWNAAEKELIRLGMKLTVLPAAEGQKLIKVYYERTWAESVIKLAPDLGPKLKKLADEFAKKHKQ